MIFLLTVKSQECRNASKYKQARLCRPYVASWSADDRGLKAIPNCHQCSATKAISVHKITVSFGNLDGVDYRKPDEVLARSHEWMFLKSKEQHTRHDSQGEKRQRRRALQQPAPSPENNINIQWCPRGNINNRPLTKRKCEYAVVVCPEYKFGSMLGLPISIGEISRPVPITEIYIRAMRWLSAPHRANCRCACGGPPLDLNCVSTFFSALSIVNECTLFLL